MLIDRFHVLLKWQVTAIELSVGPGSEIVPTVDISRTDCGTVSGIKSCLLVSSIDSDFHVFITLHSLEAGSPRALRLLYC